MWFLLAIAAAILWGLHYTLSEQVFKHISVLSELAFINLAAAAVFGVSALLSGHLKQDVETLAAQPRILIFLILSMGAFLLADLLISNSIVDRNATVASLVEISYPFFVALFSYLLFRESSLTIPTAIGGMLICSGVAVIYLFNK